MKQDKIVRAAQKLSRKYAITKGKKFRLKDYDPADTGHFTSEDKAQARDALEAGIQAMTCFQDMLYAQDKWALLLIFQAMDAAGKDSAIKHVMTGINPQGCQVASFKAPSAEELDHDYLWRCQQHLPGRGMIGIFNRSYYEEVLVVRVHPEVLENEKLPPGLMGKKLWARRLKEIRAFERYLGDNGVLVRKFFLYVSRAEQKKRFLERLENPDKNWKFSAADAEERKRWKDYMEAYTEAIQETATPEAPWYVVPADHKWFTRIVVASAVIDALASLDLGYPKLDPAKLKQLDQIRKALLRE